MKTSQSSSAEINLPIHVLSDETKLRIRAALEEMKLSEEAFYRTRHFLDEIVAKFIEKVGPGIHILDTPFNNRLELSFVKYANGDLLFNSNVYGFLASTTMNILRHSSIPLRLHSFLDIYDEVPPTTSTEATQEMRAWLIDSNTITPLISQQVIDICCTDFVDHKILSPNRNIAYSDGWEIPELSSENMA